MSRAGRWSTRRRLPRRSASGGSSRWGWTSTRRSRRYTPGCFAPPPRCSFPTWVAPRRMPGRGWGSWPPKTCWPSSRGTSPRVPSIDAEPLPSQDLGRVESPRLGKGDPDDADQRGVESDGSVELVGDGPAQESVPGGGYEKFGPDGERHLHHGQSRRSETDVVAVLPSRDRFPADDRGIGDVGDVQGVVVRIVHLEGQGEIPRLPGVGERVRQERHVDQTDLRRLEHFLDHASAGERGDREGQEEQEADPVGCAHLRYPGSLGFSGRGPPLQSSLHYRGSPGRGGALFRRPPRDRRETQGGDPAGIHGGRLFPLSRPRGGGVL